MSAQQSVASHEPIEQVNKIEYVYEAPVRIWHWLSVLSILVLIATGIFIGTPFFTRAGEDTDTLLLSYVRFAHFAAAYLFTVIFLGRIYWAFAGNEHARELLTPPIFKLQWWSEIMFELRWYFFLEDKPKQYSGHNPLALLMMFVMFFLGSIFMITTGFALYSEGAGIGHWSEVVFGWVNPLLGGSQMTHTLHRLTMWVIVCFIVIHIYAAIREDIMSRQSTISTMISGWRNFKD